MPPTGTTPQRVRRTLDRLPIWLTGCMLATSLLMILGLLGLIMARGLGTFWPTPLWELTLDDGSRYLGLMHAQEVIPDETAADGSPKLRTFFRIGNRDLYGTDFAWVDDHRVTARTKPAEAVVVERLEWGPFYGFLSEIRTPGGTAGGAPEALWSALGRELPGARRRRRAIRQLERKAIGDLNFAMEEHRLAIRRLKLRGKIETPASSAAAAKHRQAITELETRYATLAQELDLRRRDDQEYRVVLTSIEGRTRELPISSLVRVHRPNRLSVIGRSAVYADRLREFVFDQPREANSEGGVAPAIFGTVMMTLLMTLAVVPLGVLAALYLHEYAKQGALVSIVRIAVNNLAGVPSIVFGVFGLGFFCYFVGGTIDQLLFPERLPTPTFGGGGILWASMTLALLTVPVVIVATEEALAAVPNGLRAASLACGATKFQTIWRVVLPSAIPGVLTGTILAMARGAGEVAPLMITGVVKLAPDMPIDHLAPFLHLERKFMHLGFHIFDAGFQSPNVEASKAMVYMTTLLLLGIVVCLNLTAMQFRGRLREQFRGAEV
jgi:phosphate transport system permease protein